MRVRKDLWLASLFCLALAVNGTAALTQSESGAPSEESGVTDGSTPQEKATAPHTEQSAKETPTRDGSTFLQGSVTYTVPRGTPLKLKLAAVPTHAMKMMDRDLDGNLLPAKVGQELTARTSEDLYVDNNKVIPEGTIFHGRVTQVLPPRRVGRPGSLVLSFDQIITPDGRKFAFKADANNFKPSTMKTKAKGFGIIAAHAAGGAIVGALVAYQVFGLENTIAMHGYNIAGGAAAGALLATGFAVMRRGPKATLEPGDDLNMQIDSDLLMPAAVEAKVKTERNAIAGLDIKVEKSKLVRDGLGGHILNMEAWVTNDSDHKLSSIDLFVEDTNGNRSPVCSSNDEESAFLFTVEPHSRQHVHLSFAITYPKLKRRLVWLEHANKTVAYRQTLR